MATLEQLKSDLTSGDDARAEAAVPALTMHGQAAIEALAELQDSPISDHRWWATRALAAFEPEAARLQIISALDDADTAVRQCAAVGLKKRPTAVAIDPLLKLLGSENQLLGRLASDALAAIGSQAIAHLSQAAKDPEPRIRIQAVRALALMEQPEAIGPLFKAIDDPSSIVTYWAERGLDRLGIGMSFFNPG